MVLGCILVLDQTKNVFSYNLWQEVVEVLTKYQPPYLNPVKYELDCVKYITDGVELSTD